MIILQGSTGQNQPEPGAVVLLDDGCELGVGILHAVTFINDQMEPFDSAQHGAIPDDELVCREKNLEFALADPVLQ